MANKIFTPVNFILVGIAILIFAQLNLFQVSTLSAVDLIDPQTNESFNCVEVFECYTKVSGQISERGPALACVEGKCAIQNCNEGEETTTTCPDGKKIVLKNCVKGEWEFTNNFCVVQCTQNSQCWSANDQDCNGDLDPVPGTCVNNMCQFQSAPRCTQTQIYWNQYKWYLIAGIILVLGISGFIFKEQILKVF